MEAIRQVHTHNHGMSTGVCSSKEVQTLAQVLLVLRNKTLGLWTQGGRVGAFRPVLHRMPASHLNDGKLHPQAVSLIDVLTKAVSR
jgi:hypothetical protein